MSEFDIFQADAESYVHEATNGDTVKVADKTGIYIADKLRERAFSRQILTPRAVNRYDLQVSEHHDQLIFIGEKEVPTAPAKAINFRGEPDASYVETPRFNIPITEIASRVFNKKEVELIASHQPVLKIIEENTVREIEAVEDGFFLQYADAAAYAVGNLVSYSTGAGGALTKGAIKAGIGRIHRNQLRTQRILMSHVTYDDFLTMTYDELGSSLLGEVTVEGYTYKTFGGYMLIVSIKDEMFRHPTEMLANGDNARMVYFFAEEKALGYFITLDNVKFGVRRVFNKISMMAWEYIGIGFGNAKGIARVTLLD